MTDTGPSSRQPGSVPLGDDETRRRIREDLGSTLVIEAAAGTGKTSELVSRMIAVLESGAAELERIIAVTFTEKAAGEMKLRLRSAIERGRMNPAIRPDERARLDRSLAQLEVARIGTIHSLCADILRERPVEARVDPLFRVAPDEEAQLLFDEAFDRWFQTVLARPGDGVRRMLRRRSRGRGGSGPRGALREAAWKLCGQRDFDGPWKREPFDRDGAIDGAVERLRRLRGLAARADRSDDMVARCFERVERFLTELDRIETVRPRDHDGLEAELAEVARWWEWARDGRSKLYGKGLARVDVIAERDGAKAVLDAAVQRSAADLAALLHQELRPVLDEYEARKARAGVLDFLDLLLGARNLIVKDAGVREELQRRYSHVFVDEFQDTDPLQAEILLLLAADDPAEEDWTRARPIPGKLFLVGDPKQSIYRFRRADVALYEATKARLVAQGASLLYLSTSFRGAPTLQRAVNAAFAPVMGSGTGGQASYVALEPFRRDAPDRPTVIALPAPRPYGDWGVTKRNVSACIPDTVGAFVEFLVTKSGWTISERDRAEPVPIEPRHICLLFKRFQSYGDDVTRPYVRALEARRIPHVLVGGRSYHDREEVLALRNALAAIEWPDDELRVYATLRGPLFSLTDDVLLAFKAARGTLSPLRRADPSADGQEPQALRDVADALAVLAGLHLGRNRRPIADTVARLLEATRAHAGFAIWPTGEQALANVLRVADLARRFEASGATSFRAFVERLEDESESGVAAEAPVVEEGTEGVRMMTVHRAKGLEFPVVILVDPMAPPRHDNPSRWVDADRRVWAEPLAPGLAPLELIEHRSEILERDDEEAVRVAYVAATRARDILVVPVVGDRGAATSAGVLDGWFGALVPAVYPARSTQRSPRPAPGCPRFGDDTVVEWPARVMRDATFSVAPGLHAAEAGGHDVVWWDPNTLELDKDGDVGLRQERILHADESNVVSDAGERAHTAWQARRTELLARGAEPSTRVRTVTELAMEATAPAPGAPPIPHETTETVRRGRPHGKRFGTLVHALLAEVDLATDPAGVARTSTLVGRLLGASAEEIAAATTAATAALAHPLLRRAAESAARGECRREAPLILRQDDGTLVEGIVDLAFREREPTGPTWTVVDFKTDVELAASPATYEAQVSAYARAISAATGEPARGVLLSV